MMSDLAREAYDKWLKTPNKDPNKGGCYPGCYYYGDSCFRKDCVQK